MIKKFHGYDVLLSDYERNGTKYIECLVEYKERILTPEEEVRQAIISYFLNISQIDLADLLIRVEYNSLDVVFYFATHIPNFCPSFSPALIIETKRDYTNLVDWDYQISNYLTRNYCKVGLLLNSQQILAYGVSNNSLFRNEVSISNLTQICLELKKPFSEADIQDFNSACDGDFNSFKLLAEKYGRNSKLSFVCKGINAPIMNAFWIKFLGDYICFDISGEVSKARQNKIRKESFVKLLSIM